MMISDSSPLILYGRINKLDMLLKVYGEILIAPEVYQEVVVRGKEHGYPDAFLIEELVKANKIEIKYLEKAAGFQALRLQSLYGFLDPGEGETIALALQLKQKEVLIDEEMARGAARLFDLTPRGSLRVILEAYSKGIITKEDVFTILKELIDAGLRIGADVLERFYELFREMERKRKS